MTAHSSRRNRNKGGKSGGDFPDPLITPLRWFYPFFPFAMCGKIAATAPIAAVMVPIIAAMTVGFSNNPPDEVACMVTAGTGVMTGDVDMIVRAG
jgi:hypothetical protein